MLSKIKEFLDSLDKTKKILIYIGVFLLISLIGGFLNFNLYNDIFKKEAEVKNLHLKFLKIVRRISIANKNINNLKTKYNKKLQHLSLLKDDLKYLIYNIHLSNIYISQKRFYSILEKILKLSSSYNINADYIILIKDKDKFLKKYILIIEGNFPCYYYFDYLKFLKKIETLHFIKEVKEVNAIENDNYFINFKIKVIFWSIK